MYQTNKLFLSAIALIATIGTAALGTIHIAMAQPSSQASAAAYNAPPVLAAANNDGGNTKYYAAGHAAITDGTTPNQDNPSARCDINCGNH